MGHNAATLDFTGGRADIRQDVDDDFDIRVEVVDTAGDPYDLSGGTYADTTSFFTVDDTDAATGVLVLTATGQDAGSYPYAIRDTGSEITWLRGYVLVGGVGSHARGTSASTVKLTVDNGTITVETAAAGTVSPNVVRGDGTPVVGDLLKVTATSPLTVEGVDSGTYVRGQVVGEEVLASAAATIDFTSIAATHRHLRLVISGRSDAAANNDNLSLRFNNDSGTNYESQRLFASGSTVSGSRSVNATGLDVALLVGDSAAANTASSLVVDVPDYAGTTFNKSAHSRSLQNPSGSSNNVVMDNYSGIWRSTAAISRVTLVLASGQFMAGTVATLYAFDGE